MDGGVTVPTDIISDDIENGFPSIGQRPGPRPDLIYSVPSDMAEMAKKQPHVFEKEMPVNVFSPCIVSIGPLNFNNPSSSSMGNKIKKEAYEKMKKDHADVINRRPGFLAALVQRIVAREEEIKECYADRAKIPHDLSGPTFGGIMLLDSCFLLQLLDLVSDERHSNKDDEWKKDEWPHLATVFKDRHLKAMVLQDIFKIGNQIPLFVVETVADEFQISSFRSQVTETLLRIYPLSFDPHYDKFFDQVNTACDNENPHLLSLLHCFLCAPTTGPFREENIAEKIVDRLDQILQGCLDLFEAFCFRPCDLLICHNRRESNQSLNALWRVPLFLLRWIATFVTGGTCLLFLLVTFVLFFVLIFVLAIVAVILGSGVGTLLLPFFIIACLWPRRRFKQQGPAGNMFRAENLAPHISIKPYKGGINGIQFTLNDDSSLYLPQIKVEESSRVILHNVIAIEQRLANKTVCNYALLMGNLLQTPEDVEVLEDRQVLISQIEHLPQKILQSRQFMKRRQHEQQQKNKDRNWTVRMFQGLQESAAAAAAELQWWDWTDCCIKTLRQLQEDIPEPSRLAGLSISVQFWMKDLGRRYAASPWVALSTAAAAILLFMTAAQVVCLFVNCSSSRMSSPRL